MGPLTSITIVEFAGLGGAPFAGMMLADMGARVVRVERPPAKVANGIDILNRNKESICIDLKAPGASELVLNILSGADGLIESFRPGVMERLGLGPPQCASRRPSLVYGRLTGWGQTGSLAQSAGHDINYIALAGALSCIGTEAHGPIPPLALLGDFAGGGMLLAIGMLAALLEAKSSGSGQVVDASMLDGAALLMASVYGRYAAGTWSLGLGRNFIDGSAHYYTTYRCQDGKWISIGAIEPNFYKHLLAKCGLSGSNWSTQGDPNDWAVMKPRLAALFASRTRDEWCDLLEGTDACFAPVLEVNEAPQHRHNVERGTFCDVDGVIQPSPVPRFGRSETQAPRRAPAVGEQSRSIAERAGLSAREIDKLILNGILHPAPHKESTS